MKQTYLIAVAILLSASCRLFGQDSLKTNPIIYADLGFSPFISIRDGLLYDAGISYQSNQNLFTLRSTAIGHMDLVIFNPDFDVSYIYGQEALLYGRRWITGGHSFSFSAGIAFVGQTATTSYRGLLATQTHSHYFGVPFEANLLWFKGRKRRSRIYGIIPYGKPTGFGSGMGLNIAGNISAHSFMSFGLVFGLGYFKRY